MKQDAVLVTIANSAYVDAARQLFTSAFHQGGWPGAFLLLGVDLKDEEARWFVERGVEVRSLVLSSNGADIRTRILLGKLALFSTPMKAWRNVVFADADMIVRARIADLGEVRGFNAVRGIGMPTLARRFLRPDSSDFEGSALYRELCGHFPLSSPAFNGGLYAFSTDLISESTSAELELLWSKYGRIIRHRVSDEAVLGLRFCGTWKRLPLECNTYLSHYGMTTPALARGRILHFVSTTLPWDAKSPFLEEWSNNLGRADSTDFAAEPRPGVRWSWLRRVSIRADLTLRYWLYRAYRRLKAPLLRLVRGR